MNTKEIAHSKRQGKNPARRLISEEKYKKDEWCWTKDRKAMSWQERAAQNEHKWKEQCAFGTRCCIWYLGYVQLAVCRFSKLGEHAKFPQDECER